MFQMINTIDRQTQSNETMNIISKEDSQIVEDEPLSHVFLQLSMIKP